MQTVFFVLINSTLSLAKAVVKGILLVMELVLPTVKLRRVFTALSVLITLITK